MDLTHYLSLAAFSFAFAISPGPGIVAVLVTSIRSGLRPAAAMSVGEVFGDMLYLLTVMVSLANLAHHLEDFLLVVRIFGAGYLGFIGYRSFFAPPITIDDAKAAKKSIIWAFGAGFMISITNPKVIIFYSSFLPLFIDLSAIDFRGGAAVVGVMFFSVLAGPMLVAFLGVPARKLATGARSGRWMMRITGLMLISIAIALIATI